jgi:hypothetical protein
VEGESQTDSSYDDDGQWLYLGVRVTISQVIGFGDSFKIGKAYEAYACEMFLE